jgi:hypothetical protein
LPIENLTNRIQLELSKGTIMEINAGHSSVNIAIAVQPRNAASRGEDVENNSDYQGAAGNYAAQEPSLNTRGEEVGNVINTWA